MMNKFLALILAAAAVVPAMPVHAGPGGAQEKARRDVRAGNVRSLRDIEGAVLPQMQGAQYIGPEYDPAAFVYRLKFIQDGHVIFVDVDARTGQVIRQSR
jgi:uncharacterized membrane protein YkoI